MTSHIEEHAYREGYKLLLCNSWQDKLKEQEYINMLRASRVDGIIMGSHTLEVEDYRQMNLPLVTFDRQISPNIPYVCSDNYAGGRLATTLLIEKGCRRLAHIGGHPKLNILSHLRCVAFEETAKQHGAQYVSLHTDNNSFDFEAYELLLAQLFREHPEVDGIFAGSDIIAACALKACQIRGRRVPEDVRIIGYDGITLRSLLYPAISSIRQPMEAMGKLAVDLILRQVQGEPVESAYILPVELEEGATT